MRPEGRDRDDLHRGVARQNALTCREERVRTNSLASDFAEIRTLVDSLLANVSGSQADTEVDRVRALGTTLLQRLLDHRQHGFDLVYEAYEPDIGGDLTRTALAAGTGEPDSRGRRFRGTANAIESARYGGLPAGVRPGLPVGVRPQGASFMPFRSLPVA